MPDPIKITFYNPDDSVKAEYSKLRIPLGLVDIALDLAESKEQKSDQETWDAIKAFIVEVFGGQFTLDELNKGADLVDVMSVFAMVVAKVNHVSRFFNPNPLRPESRPEPTKSEAPSSTSK
jgi:hypothetical protein